MSTTTPDPSPAESGRCGQTFRGIVLNGERPTACCDLLAGHPGWHRDRAHGMEWGATDSADALASLRAELARVRPVVDAARFLAQQQGSWDVDNAVLLLRGAVAALDGDAAATPQPASSAPPADVTARLAAAADALDAIGWAGLGYDLRDIAQQLTPGDPNSDGGVEAAAAVVARALATPTTEET